MKCIPITTDIIKPGDDLLSHLEEAGLEEKDVLVVSSKVVSVCEGRTVSLSDYTPSSDAQEWAEKTGLPAEFCEAVLQEADTIIGGCPGAILTLKEGNFIANAGIDMSNTPAGTCILWPKDPMSSAQNLQEALGFKELGIIISDSRCLPLRQGTVGFALAFAGMEPVIDERGQQGLYGNTYRVTQRNMVDGLAVAANLLMGDTDEKVPFVIVRDVELEFTNTPQSKIAMDKNECLFKDLYSW